MAHQEITTNQCRPLSLAEPHVEEPFVCTQLGRLAAASARALRIETSDFDAGRSSTTSTPATGHRTGSPTARPTRILTTPAPPHSTSAPTTSTPPWPGSGATQRNIQASQGNRPRLLPRPAADLTPPTRARASLTLPVGIAVTPARTRRPDRHLDPHRFRRHHPKWHDGLRGENRKWDRLARSTPRSIRTRPWSW